MKTRFGTDTHGSLLAVGPTKVRCLMFGLGSGPFFIRDWAAAVATFAEVVGITVIRRFPSDSAQIWKGAALTSVGGFPVVMLKRPPLPKGVLGGLGRLLMRRQVLHAARWLIEEYGPINIIHSHFYSGAAVVPFVASRLGVPFVHTEHSSALAGASPENRVSRSGWRILRRVLSGAARVFFVGSSQLATVERLGLSGNFEVLPNPVDAASFHPNQQGHEGLRLVTVGHLIPRKRHHLAIEAVSLIRAQGRQVTLEIVGGGRDEAKLRAFASSLGIEAAVNFRGRVPREEVAACLSRADIYLHTSEMESFGVSIVEALFSGLPVVAIRAGGITDELPSRWGVTVQSPEPAALADAIVHLDLSLYIPDEIAAASKELFSSQKVALRLEQIYASVLAS